MTVFDILSIETNKDAQRPTTQNLYVKEKQD